MSMFIYTVRSMRPSDLNLILNSWMLSNRWTEAKMENVGYFPSMERKIRMILERATVTVFCNENVDQVYGWCCYESYPGCHIVHYAYLKNSFREFGIFRKFAEETFTKDRPIYITHSTKKLDYLKAVHGISYDPMLAWLGSYRWQSKSA